MRLYSHFDFGMADEMFKESFGEQLWRQVGIPTLHVIIFAVGVPSNVVVLPAPCTMRAL